MTDTTPSDSSPTDSMRSDTPVDADPGEGAPADSSGAPGSSGGRRSAEKDPSDWVTGDEPMTGPQGSYLGTLAREAGEDLPDDLTKAEASQQIDRLQSETGRGA